MPRRGHVRTALAGQLDRDSPDAAVRAGDQHALAEYEADDLERPQRRQTGGGQRGGLRVGYLVGDRRQAAGWNRGELRPGAGVDQADHADALPRSAAVGGGTFDHACHIPTREGTLRQVRKASDLTAIERERPHPYQRLIRQRCGVYDLGQLHVRERRGRCKLDHEDTATLLEGHAVADAAGDRYEATRALGNLGYNLMLWAQPAAALRYSEQALAYAREHEIHSLASYIATLIAWLRLRAGEWDEAERLTRSEIERGSTVPQLLAKTVLTELAVRRGDPDASERLADLAAQADRTDELQRLAPVLELATEWALTSGAPMPTERFGKIVEEIRPRSRFANWGAIRVAAWATVAGIDIESDQPMSTPYAAMLRRDWLGAADAFGEVGWIYDRALMLSLLDDEESLVEAIEIARGLGAEPLTRRVAGRMRELGLSIPHGPRESTRANPPDRASARGPLARGSGAHECGDRRAAVRVAANRRAPRGCRAEKARGDDEAGGRTARIRAPAGGAHLSGPRLRYSSTPRPTIGVMRSLTSGATRSWKSPVQPISSASWKRISWSTNTPRTTPSTCSQPSAGDSNASVP